MIEFYKLDSPRAKALAQIIEAPTGLSPQDFHVLPAPVPQAQVRQGFSLPKPKGGK